MLRILVAAAAFSPINADETVTLKQDAPPAEDEPEVSVDELAGRRLHARRRRDYENEAAKEAERVAVPGRGAERKLARGPSTRNAEEAQRQRAAAGRPDGGVGTRQGRGAGGAGGRGRGRRRGRAGGRSRDGDAHADARRAAELAQAYAAAAEAGGIGDEEEAADAAPEAADEEEARAGRRRSRPRPPRRSRRRTPAPREAVAQQRRQLREAELARRAEQQATYAAAQRQAGVNTDGRESTRCHQAGAAVAARKRLRPADADQLKDIYQRTKSWPRCGPPSRPAELGGPRPGPSSGARAAELRGRGQ